jgi:hypothetical protein
MLRRCPRARLDAVGVLRDHRLAFAGWSSSWEGAVATVLPKLGTTVHGVLYALDDASLAALDRYEGHPTVYHRRKITIDVAGQRSRSAHVYCLSPYLPAAQPSARYFLTIMRAYRELGFDEEPLLNAVLGL